ncbi:MAG: hypothetical protein ACREJF_07620, partial [Candidatus Methylomirabilales bacterium]
MKIHLPDGRVVHVPDGTPPAEIEKLLMPDSPGLEDVASDLPGGGFVSPPERGSGLPPAIAPLAGGLKAVGQDLATLGNLAMSPTGSGKGPLSGVREALEPRSDEKTGAAVARFLEFFTPGPVKGGNALRAALKGVIEGGVVGSAQAGKPSPGAALGGGLGGTVGHGLVAGLGKMARAWLKKAPEQYASASGARAGRTGEAALEGAEEGLKRGTLKGGTPEEMLAQAGENKAATAKARDAYRATTNEGLSDPAEIEAAVMREAGSTQRTGTKNLEFDIDEKTTDAIKKIAQEASKMRTGST